MHTGAPAEADGLPPLLSVVLPAYEEAAIIEHSLELVWTHLQGIAGWAAELVVVDDGSSDETYALAQAFAAGHEGVRVLRHASNRELGTALRTGIRATRGDVVVTYDVDLSYDVTHIDRMLTLQQETGAEVVVASPYMPGGASIGVPRALLWRSRAANRFLAAAAQDTVHTLTGLVRAYDGRWLRSLSLKAEQVDVNAEVLYKAMLLRARIVEVPATLDWTRVPERRARHGLASSRSRWGTYKTLVAGFIFRPFLFPLMAGAGLAALGLLLLIVTDGRKGPLLGAALLAACLAVGGPGMPGVQAKRYFEELFALGSRQLRLARAWEERGFTEARRRAAGLDAVPTADPTAPADLPAAQAATPRQAPGQRVRAAEPAASASRPRR